MSNAFDYYLHIRPYHETDAEFSAAADPHRHSIALGATRAACADGTALRHEFRCRCGAHRSGRGRARRSGAEAEQFLVLITGPMEGRSRLGTRKVATAEMHAVATAAVDTFLRAYEAPENQ
ncbi:TetR/AcrR family transcriptional regulator C-terminal domain-containing protein [Nocardia asteroides]